jgi:RND superfamily putative drug exporter
MSDDRHTTVDPTTGRASTTERLARGAARRPWLTLTVWLLIVAAAVALYAAFGVNYKARESFLADPESRRAADLIAERLPSARHNTEVVIVRSRRFAVDDPAFRAVVADLRRDILAIGRQDILSVTTYQTAAEKLRPFLVSESGHATIMPVVMAGGMLESEEHVTGLLDVVAAADDRPGFTVAVTGAGSWNWEADLLAEQDLRRAEVIGIPAALIILVVVFGSLVAAAMPLVLAGVAIFTASAVTALIGEAFSLSVFALNIITSMGLAVGIDYALFIVSRYREETNAGLSPAEAVARTGGTANRAVLFSGLTVVFSLLGMLVVPYSVFTSLGLGASMVVLVAVAAALTLLPALFALLGRRIDALKLRWPRRRRDRAAGGAPPDAVGDPRPGVGGARPAAADTRLAAAADPPDTAVTVTQVTAAAEPAIGQTEGERGGGWWGRAAAVIMRRPTISLLLGVAVLLAVATPTFFMVRGATGVTGLPDELNAKRGFDLLSEEFPAGWTAPTQVVIDGPLLIPAVLAGIGRLRSELATDGRFTPTGFETANDGTTAVLTLVQDEPPTSEQALQNIRDLRRDLIPAAMGQAPATVLVGGTTAGFVDGLHMIDVYQPIVIALVLFLSFCLLLVAFRSLLVAATCIAMNLLSVGAAYGALVIVFQYGLGNELFGFRAVDKVEAWVPLLMFCVLFGLSMDYQVFLLSRIRERYDEHGETREAVAFGIRSTAGIITGAALIMVAVFAGLASGRLVMFQQIGFGLAVAVLLDATIVRIVIAPAVITLIGDRYWWLPRGLEWLPRINVGERDAPPASVGAR